MPEQPSTPVHVVEKKATPENVRKRNLNPSVESSVDLASNILTPQTGRSKLGPDLIEFYNIKGIRPDKGVEENSAWDIFSSVTSDTRISNLDPLKQEYPYVQWAMKEQLMLLQLRLPKSAAFAQMLALSVTEPSLAKNMAFLKNIQTVRQESQHVQIEKNPESRNMLGKIVDKIKGE